jgi:beta-lactamase regulating signal transducer with metallopeptidase domain
MTMFDPWTVASIALKTTLLVAAAGLAVRVAARQSAAWRHLVWSSALTLSLLMPIAVLVLPSYWQLRLPWQATESRVRDEPLLLTAGARQVSSEPNVPDPSTSESASVERQARAAWPTAMIVWLIGAIGVWLRNALAHVGLIRWAREARPRLSPAWAATVRRVASAARFRRSLRVLESDDATSPCTWGLVRPVVLLPGAGADWPEPQRRFVLLHELAHVRRFDYLTTQIASLACAVHWYNPLVWFAAVQAGNLQEQACDDAVLNAGGMPSDYAQFLVGIAGSRSESLAFPVAVGMVRRSQLHGRVSAILDATRVRVPLSGVTALVALAPLACLMLVLATVSAAAVPLALEPGIAFTASFSSVELRNGGTVTLIHGPSPRVTLREGDPALTAITIGSDGRLVIDRCPRHCPRAHHLEVEIETPALAAITVSEGGIIQSRGTFPLQLEIDVAVNQGGTIDMRSMAVANVSASVYSGGRIFTRPGATLAARVEQGGNVTYWGDAVVESSVRHGGVVAEGSAADADRRLAELLGPVFRAPVPPAAPVPPIPAVPAASY